MAYPGQFVRLVIIGTLYDDIFNTTLAIVPSALGELGMPAVDAPTLAAVAADVGAWFPVVHTTTGGPGFSSSAKLTSIKLNRIGTDGRYVDNETREHIYPTPIAGGLGQTGIPQVSAAVTLRTAIERGRGSRGRMYLPPSNASMAVQSDGRISTGAAQVQAAAVKNLIERLNSTYTLIGRVGVASNAGTGRFEHVTRVECGRVLDTIRSRRNKLVESYAEGADIA